MRLEYLCDMDLAYRQELFGKSVLVKPYGGDEGRGYGEGDGKVFGESLRGVVRWVNHPRRRSDGTMLPDLHGVIQTGDGAQILFSLQGRTSWIGGGEARRGRQVMTALFESADERYRWLNDVLCVLEGAFDPRSMQMRSKVYVCINEIA